MGPFGNSTFEYELLQADDSLFNFLGPLTERTYWEFDSGGPPVSNSGMHQSIIPFEMIVATSRIGKFPDILQRWEVASVNTIPSFNMNLLETCGTAGLLNFWACSGQFTNALYQEHIALHYDNKTKTWEEPLSAFLNVDVAKDGEKPAPRGNGTWPLEGSGFFAVEMSKVLPMSERWGQSSTSSYLLSKA